jgi:hypothetical protein
MNRHDGATHHSYMHASAHSGLTIDIYATYHFDKASACNDFSISGYILFLHNIWRRGRRLQRAFEPAIGCNVA